MVKSFLGQIRQSFMPFKGEVKVFVPSMVSTLYVVLLIAAARDACEGISPLEPLTPFSLTQMISVFSMADLNSANVSQTTGSSTVPVPVVPAISPSVYADAVRLMAGSIPSTMASVSSKLSSRFGFAFFVLLIKLPP